MVTVEKVPTRTFAEVFDIPVLGPTETHQGSYDSEAIGGSYSSWWFEYFRDVDTGETYRVECGDGVYGGKDAYSPKDVAWRNPCYYVLADRFQAKEKAGVSEIHISRNERIVMQGFIHSSLLESAEDKGDGKQSEDGLDGGLVGYYHGIPVICDTSQKDDLPPR